MKLQGKVAIVTGAAQGFGRGIAELFASEGAKVCVADLNGDGARATAKEIGSAAIPFEVNVADRS
ncbi:MAG: SDR family NAD(P)-dependent oxidoreductase, partial [Pseudomonadota bacterium]